MPSITRAAAAVGAVAALAAASAAPASAQDANVAIGTNQCVQDLTVPSCAEWAFDTADYAVGVVEGVYNTYGRPYVCDVHWILTGDTCPAPPSLAIR